MLSHTVFHGKSANCWNTTARVGPGWPSPARRRRATVPPVGNSRPAAMRMQVVLPQPDGPTMATNSRSLHLEVDALQGGEVLAVRA